MHLIKPGWNNISMGIIPWEEVNGITVLKHLERIGRKSYKSEDKITDTSATSFIKARLTGAIKHTAILDHLQITAEYMSDRGVSHEWLRHKLTDMLGEGCVEPVDDFKPMAAMQECVAGDTVVYQKGKLKVTIKQLYDKDINLDTLKSINEYGIVINNKIKKIMYNGEKDIYFVKTRLGYQIKCTNLHKFLKSDGTFCELKKINIGDSVFVNGRPCLLRLSDLQLKNLYLEEKLSPLKIAEMYSVPYGTVLRRLKQIGIFENHLNDSEKEKYNKNHTKKSYEKMKISVINGFKNGRIVWNKGLTENDSESIKKQGDALRKNHYKNKFGQENSNWKNGISTYRNQKSKEHLCELCNSNQRLEVHHIDFDRSNNEKKNLIKVCDKCHRLLHRGWHIYTLVIPDKITEIKKIGKEKVYDIEMEAPYHNYIANGFIVHNSTRYCNYMKKGGVVFIIPEWIKNIPEGEYNMNELWENPSSKERALYDTLSNSEQLWLKGKLHSEYIYLELLKNGRTPQEARGDLCIAVKTEFIVTCSLTEWRHVMNLRTDNAAHPDMKIIMRPQLEEFKKKIPVIFDDIIYEKEK